MKLDWNKTMKKARDFIVFVMFMLMLVATFERVFPFWAFVLVWLVIAVILNRKWLKGWGENWWMMMKMAWNSGQQNRKRKR